MSTEDLLKIVDDSSNQTFQIERSLMLQRTLGAIFTHHDTAYEIRGINRNDGITGHPSVNKPCEYIWRVKKSVRFKQRYAGGCIDAHTSAVHVVKRT